MDLRDRFAAHFAAALVDALADAGEVARRAYDLADAMLEERARRIDADERRAIEAEARTEPLDAFLDQLDPSGEELAPGWLEKLYDPSWDLEPEKSGEPVEEARPSRPPGPGLTRTQPEQVEERKEHSA